MCESEEEQDLKTSYFLSRPTEKINRHSNNYLSKRNTSGTKHILQNSVDPNYLYSFSKRIVRIEYPGLVKNAARAIETLGGMHEIQMAVADHRNKLELHFHPENKFSKPCCAERDINPGVLIKIKQTQGRSQKQSLKDSKEVSNIKYHYEVVGITSLNFKFNRICDFQYLPLISHATEDNEFDTEYVYNKILPEKLPLLEWFLSKESAEQPKFYIPTSFARFDYAQNKLFVNPSEKFESSVRPDISKLIENKLPRRSKHIFTKQVSIFVNFQIPNVQVPDQPLSYTMELIKERNLESMYQVVRQLFEERPVWTKVAIQYKTGLNTDHAKIVLPAVAYFCPIGPWRMTWVRYEYNPQKDFNSRIYQTLDYRIRATEGAKIKVYAKRNYTSKTSVPTNVKKVSLKDNISLFKKDALEERSHVLRPNYIPPARQMFYQYCDILIPEIQEMISRLPKLPSGAKFDPKNGWLPVNFTEQCREIVNKYVMDRVQEELLEDTIKLQQQQNPENFEKEYSKEKSATYCSKMLSNIKKGIYRSVNVVPTHEAKDEIDMSAPIHTVDLIEDIDEDGEVNADDVVNSIPERMEENSDDEHLSQNSDLDIDMEAVEEINKMIAGIQEDEEVNVVASYLKNKI